MTRAAAFLRRLADWLDRQAASAPAAAPERVMVEVSREEVRELQAQWLALAQESFSMARACGPQDGMLWLERATLEGLRSLIGIELELRDDDYLAVERDPTVRLR